MFGREGPRSAERFRVKYVIRPVIVSNLKDL